MKNDRRKFLQNLGLATVAGLGSATLLNGQEKKNVNIITSKKKYQWRMVTTWPPKFPVVGEGAELLADWVYRASGGRMEIKVYGSGELIPALECFDAVSQGGAHLASSVSYYWAGKVKSSPFFAAVPFGMNAQQMNTWLIAGGGLELWQKIYAEHNLIPFPGGNTGVQMGGWFRKEIKSMQDIQGLKMRIPGLGGKVLAKAGGTAVLVPGAELYTNLERGVIDATEWIGPYHDYKMGFYEVAKYYYYPGWHEPGPTLEIFVNKKQYEELPKDLQAIIKTAIYRINAWVLGEFEAKNNIYLKKIIEKGVKLKRFSNEILEKFKGYAKEVIAELIASDTWSKKVYESYNKFRKENKAWSAYGEKGFFDLIQ